MAIDRYTRAGRAGIGKVGGNCRLCPQKSSLNIDEARPVRWKFELIVACSRCRCRRQVYLPSCSCFSRLFDECAVVGASIENPGLREDGCARARLKFTPKCDRAPRQRDICLTLVMGNAQEPRLTVRTAVIVGRRKLVKADRVYAGARKG